MAEIDHHISGNVALCSQGKHGIATACSRIEIDAGHPYVSGRASWEDYIANRLKERFAALAGRAASSGGAASNSKEAHANGSALTGRAAISGSSVISDEEAEAITNAMRQQKAANTLSFLHLDMRRINMIYNDGDIFLLDAENCEFGDPLFELATIDVAGEISPVLIDGYKSTYRSGIDLNCDLYKFYKMERLALVLSVFMYEVNDDAASTRHYMKRFLEAKKELLKLI